MQRILLNSTAALGLLMTPALAQDSGTTTQTTEPMNATDTATPGTDSAASATSADTASESSMSADASASAMGTDEEARSSAMRNAEAVGMQDVRVLDRVFVVEGTTEAGQQVYMIVNPPGVLLGVGAPMTADASAGAGVDTTTTSSTTPTAGEPADSGYMATQANPASPQMWDPEAFENALSSLPEPDAQ